MVESYLMSWIDIFKVEVVIGNNYSIGVINRIACNKTIK